MARTPRSRHTLGVLASAGDARMPAMRLGVAEFLHHHPDVAVSFFEHPARYPVQYLRAVEGFIIQPHNAERTFGQIRRIGRPFVTLDYGPATEHCPNVRVDDRAVGRAAGEHLASCGVKSLGFFGVLGRDADVRCEGVAAFARQEGLAFSRFDDFPPGQEDNWLYLRDEKRVGPWLDSLPTPTGVMAFNDEAARRLSYVCGLRGIAIPDALAVCGVDDSQIARFSVPSITSVNVNAPEITRTAAEMLLAMLDGVEVGPRRHLVQPAGVVVRESTGVLHHDEPTVASALRFMLAHIEEDISAEDVAAGAGVSRSTLDRLFRRERLPAPMTQLRRFRLERARSLLVSTDLPLADVAVRSGFAYLSHFSRTFKAAEGRTPSDYRRANQFATAGPQPF